MSGEIPPRSNGLPISAVHRIDAACDRFEAAWRDGPRPQIEDFLADAIPTEREALLRELLELDVELRRQIGEKPKFDDYKARFPDDIPLIRRVLGLSSDSEESVTESENHPEEVATPCDSSLPPPIPDKIGRYKVLRHLGGGGYGDVYVAHDEVMGRQVAIKVPNAKLLVTKRAKERFIHEARSAARLEHDGIVRAYDFGQEEGEFCFIVYEYVEGVTLADRAKQSAISPVEVAHIVADVAEALHFAHQKDVIHRDVKPANILLDRNGKPRVADFGLAAREEDLADQRGRLAGTWPYLSPEQVRGDGHHVDGRSDIYSLGVVLYEMLCGRRPFRGKTEDELAEQILYREAKPPRQINDSITPELERICLKALSKQVLDRYTTAKDMAAELRQVVTNFPSPQTNRRPQIDLRGIEQRVGSLGESELQSLLVQLAKQTFDPGCIPLVFRCLAHSSESIRARAREAVHTFGWDGVAAAAIDLARKNDPSGTAAVLDGLTAFEAHPRIVTLLDQLVYLLNGDLRNRAILLLERKRLGLDLDAVVALFREINSPYRIERALGQGLFAATFLATIDGTEVKVVVRVLRREFVNQPLLRTQFLDLTQKSLRLVHEKLVLTREARAFPDRNTYYAVRDYVDGVTLQKVLEGGKRFQPEQIAQILGQLLMALEPVHRIGLCHCGIKPSNIFLCDGDRIILGDPSLPVQGVGVALDRLSYDYRYVAPEVFSGTTGPQADFYSLGCVGYELACGSPPFEADNYLELAARHLRDTVVPPSRRGSLLGPSRDAVLVKLLARSAAERYAKIGDIRQALSQSATSATGENAKGRVPFVGEVSMERYRGAESVMGLEASGAAQELRSDKTVTGGEYGPEPSNELPKHIGDYEILEMRGTGGMGIVYKARDPRLNRMAAIKAVLGIHGHTASEARSQRFSREAMMLAQLDHPNIVRIYDVGVSDSLDYLVMEFVEGGSLAQKLRDGGRFDSRVAVALVGKLARAVDHAHQYSIVHRDLKPSNILLTKEGEPKIADFGLAKLVERASEDVMSTREGMIVGTPAYMSPEQAAGRVKEIGPATDVYGLGAILYELLTGERAFQRENIMGTLTQLATEPAIRPSVLNRTIDRALDTICLKCLEKDPSNRYPSAGDLAADLDRWQAGAPISANPVGARWWHRLFAWRRRR